MQEDIYRQSGSPEVDAAWEALGVDCRWLDRELPMFLANALPDRAGVIPFEEGLRSGLTSAHVQRSAKYGGGFFVNVEGLHHLHCLVSHSFRPLGRYAHGLQNLLRKSLYFNYPRYKAMGAHAFKNEDDILQLHVSKCCLPSNFHLGSGGLTLYSALPRHATAGPDVQRRHRSARSGVVQQG